MAKPGHDISSIVDLLSGDKIYTVPRYQRGYAWDETKFKELWDDIISFCMKDKDLFMGSVILSKAASRHSGVEAFEIIDGQQRLTTFTILFRAMHDVLKDEDNKERFQKELIELISHTRSGYKLTLGKEDEEFFEKVIKQITPNALRGKKKSHKMIKSAYDYFVAQLLAATKDGESLYDFVDTLEKKLKQRTQLLILTVEDDANAYLIFESINAKRVDLAPAELIKNKLFSIASQSETDLITVEQSWDNISAILNPEAVKEISLTQFMRHYWISTRSDVREKELYALLKVEMKDSVTEVTKLLEPLPQEAAAYSIILYPELEHSYVDLPNTTKMKSLNRLGFRQAYPFMLSVVRKVKKQDVIDDTISILENAIMRRSIVGSNPNELESMLSEWSRKVDIGGDTVLDEFKRQISSLVPADEALTMVISEGSYTPNQRFILEELEKSKTKGEKENASLTIEHIMPQNPVAYSEWGVSREEHEAWADNIGNLTLLGKSLNSTIQNSSFDLKVPYYKISEYRMTQELAKLSVWDKSTIKSRAQEIAVFINSRWPL